MNSTHTSTSAQSHGITLSQVCGPCSPWRWWLTLVGLSMLLGAVLELAPPSW